MSNRRRGARLPSGIGQLVGAAWKGDTDAERQLLELFCEDVKKELSIPRPVLQYLAGRFQRLLAGQAAFVAKPHRPASAAKRARDERIVASVAEWRHRGHSRKRAVMETAEQFGVKPRTVEAIIDSDRAGRIAAFSERRHAISMLTSEERRVLRSRRKGP